MNFAILRPTALEAEDTGQPITRRLSILAAETLGFEIRRRVTHGLERHPNGLVVFDWRAVGQADWKSSPPSFATDIRAALDLLVDAAQRGYLVETVTSEPYGGQAMCSSVRISMPPVRSAPSTWAAAATAHRPTLQEAITVAYLAVSRTIHPIEDPCPVPT